MKKIIIFSIILANKIHGGKSTNLIELAIQEKSKQLRTYLSTLNFQLKLTEINHIARLNQICDNQQGLVSEKIKTEFQTLSVEFGILLKKKATQN